MSDDVVVGEIVGHRIWFFYEEDNEYPLKSLNLNYRWNPKINFNYDRLVMNSGIGFFSFKNKNLINELIEEYYDYFLAHSHYPIVMGEIYHWGKVVEHERGYRSEYAKIKKLTKILKVYKFFDTLRIQDIFDYRILALNERYGVSEND